jgi:lysophospholipase L1-like esterase
MNRKNSLITFLFCCLIAFSSLALAEIRVACVGDSITAGWKLKEADKYVTKLGGLLGSDYDVQNFGHSSYSMLTIADKSYWNSPMFQAAQDFQPDIVTIMLGTNDAHPDYWPLYENLYVTDYLDMIAFFQDPPFHSTVIVLGLPWLKPGGRYDGVVALDALLPGIASQAGAEFVEIWDILVNSGLSQNQLMKDPIHPSAAAHSIIAETIYPVIAGLGSVCGNGICDVGEDVCNCAVDCGAPPGSETVCSDLVDEDCDGLTDCNDPDCTDSTDCQIPCNDNGECESGEDCNTCPNDCDGNRKGRPSGRYCCGNGIQEDPEYDGRCDGVY